MSRYSKTILAPGKFRMSSKRRTHNGCISFSNRILPGRYRELLWSRG